MGSGASVLQGNQRVLAVFYTARDGLLVIDGRIAGRNSDSDMETEEYESPYWEPYDGPLADTPSWEPFTNTRGGDVDSNKTFDDDWIPDFETKSE